ncbi:MULTISPECIES: HupE/UreJ family protein [unclassified Sphingobium]|uniref:HupE/UreJ family protein n=1 Tax=unclassified Sphingobium TaxID=2611147 RepID=UPI00222484D5|nr:MULTISPECIES: HupE/UreJ family protein [unclassified Sphingobium]MCW2380483.1 urease accessory protein [Sphingobium sp. B2D3B]MCW2399410.1 urease accessory protein [Sphingobium sp. B2D3C]
MIRHFKTALVAMIALMLPAAAQAHPGHEVASPLVSGLLHPLTGADHLVAMVMVGLWGGMLAGRAKWAAPAAFVGAMVIGFGYALLGQPAGLAEGGILLSILLLGLALALRLKVSWAVAAAVTGAFGFVHGMAHGLEAPAGDVATFAFGFIGATAALHALGVVIGSRVPVQALRAMGTVGAGFAVFLLAA